jgi:hypothetical protein
MSKKDILNLILPSLIFVVVAAVLLFAARKIGGDAAEISADQQIFGSFADAVQSGKTPLTTDRAIVIIRQERTTVDSYRMACASLVRLLQVLGFASIVGFGLHIFVLFQVRRRLKKLMPNKSPEPTAVGAGSSAVAVHAASRRWLSFFR